MKIKRLIQNQTLFVALVFIMTFGIRLYYVFQKEEMHLDEVLSVVLSSYNDYCWVSNYDEDKIYTGKELKEITFFENRSIKNAFQDIYNLRIDNRDSPHTNLYYSFFRLWFTSTQTGDVHRIIIQGCLLNLLFFSLSFFFMYKLVKLLFIDNWVILVSLSVAFLNIGSISNTVFMRPYLLQETIFIVFVYLFVYLYQKIELKKPIDSWQNLILIAFIVGLTLLSGYFAIFFIIPFGIFLLYKLYEKREFKSIYFIICAFVSSVVFVFAVFPRYGEGFITYRGKEAIQKFTGNNVIENILVSLRELFYIIHENLFYTSLLFLIIIALFYLLWEKRQLYAFKNLLTIQPLPIILLISLLWASTIIIAAPFKNIRYIAPVLPLLSLFIPYIVLKFRRKKIFIVSLLLCVGIYGSMALNKEYIDYLFIDFSKNVIFNQYPESPAIIYLNNSNGRFDKNGSLISHVANNQNYEFPHSENSLLEIVKKYEKAILFIEESDNIDIERSFRNYFLEKFDSELEFFTVYYMVRK